MTTSLLSAPMIARAQLGNPSLRMFTSLLSAPMIAHAQLGNPPLRMSTRIVCGLPDYYLIVKPDVVWLTESNDWSHDFEVQSNVDWIVDY